jgi:hypothetical protein
VELDLDTGDATVRRRRMPGVVEDEDLDKEFHVNEIEEVPSRTCTGI